MDSRRLTIPVTEDESVSAILTMPTNKRRMDSAGVITVHGAGNDMEKSTPRCFYRWLGQSRLSYVTIQFSLQREGSEGAG